MRIFCDSLYGIYTGESVLDYMRKYIVHEVAEKSARLFVRVIKSIYAANMSEIETKDLFPEFTDTEIRRHAREWNLARFVRKQGTSSLIINGELLLRQPKNNLEYTEEAEELNQLVSEYRPFTGTEIAFMLQWRNDAGTDKDLFLRNVREMLKANPGLGLTALLESACREHSQEDINKSAAEYSLAYRLMNIFGQNQTEPTEKDMQYIRKWRNDWQYTEQEIIDAAMDDFESPTYDYLNGILRNIYEVKKAAGLSFEEVRVLSKGLKTINKVLSCNDLRVDSLLMYKRLLEQYGYEMILLAADECAENNKRQLVYVARQLTKWANNNIDTKEKVQNDRIKKDYAKTLLEKVYALWYGEELLKPAIKAEDVRYAERWLKLGVPEALILHGATYAMEADKPIIYLNQIVRHYKKMGFKTVHEAIVDKQQHKEETIRSKKKEEEKKKSLPSAGFSQRSYAGEDLVVKTEFLVNVFESQGKTTQEARQEAIKYAMSTASCNEEKEAVMRLKSDWGV